MKRKRPLTELQKIWLLSRVNGQDNHQELLPRRHIEWPRDGYLTRRLAEKRRDDDQR
jgi:hypothetical protein